MGASQRPGTLTHHGEGPDAGLRRALVLLLQPRTLEQPRSGLQQLHHDRLVCLQKEQLLQRGPPSTLGSRPRDQSPLRRAWAEGQAPTATMCSVPAGKRCPSLCPTRQLPTGALGELPRSSSGASHSTAGPFFLSKIFK